MPLCSCGLKVDRKKNKDSKEKDKETISCTLCNNIFHPECCNITDDDLPLVKNTFKCKNCIRRGSAPLITAASKTDNLDEMDTNSGSENTPASTAEIVSANNPTAATTLTVDVPTAELLTGDSSVLLQLLLRELADIKKSNAELSAEVSSLRKDNALLMVKFDALQSAMECNWSAPKQDELANSDRSPKRKKNLSTTSSNTPASNAVRSKTRRKSVSSNAISGAVALSLGNSPLTTAVDGTTAGSSSNQRTSYVNNFKCKNCIRRGSAPPIPAASNGY